MAVQQRFASRGNDNPLTGRLIGIAVLEVGTYRDLDGGGDLGDVAHRFIERHCAQSVRPAQADGETAAGRPQCLEAMGRYDFG